MPTVGGVSQVGYMQAREGQTSEKAVHVYNITVFNSSMHHAVASLFVALPIAWPALYGQTSTLQPDTPVSS